MTAMNRRGLGMSRRTFVSPDGQAVVTFDGGAISDVWTLSVGQRVVAKQKVGFLSNMATASSGETNGWGGFDLRGGGYEVKVMFNARSREARVLFKPNGMTWAEVERKLRDGSW